MLRLFRDNCLEPGLSLLQSPALHPEPDQREERLGRERLLCQRPVESRLRLIPLLLRRGRLPFRQIDFSAIGPGGTEAGQRVVRTIPILLLHLDLIEEAQKREIAGIAGQQRVEPLLRLLQPAAGHVQSDQHNLGLGVSRSQGDGLFQTFTRQSEIAVHQLRAPQEHVDVRRFRRILQDRSKILGRRLPVPALQGDLAAQQQGIRRKRIVFENLLQRPLGLVLPSCRPFQTGQFHLRVQAFRFP